MMPCKVFNGCSVLFMVTLCAEALFSWEVADSDIIPEEWDVEIPVSCSTLIEESHWWIEEVKAALEFEQGIFSSNHRKMFCKSLLRTIEEARLSNDCPFDPDKVFPSLLGEYRRLCVLFDS